MNFVKIEINTTDTNKQEIIIAELTNLGYEGFEQTNDAVIAFMNENDFNDIELDVLMSEYKLTYNRTSIPKQNWNEVWESNFEPVIVDDFVGVRAHFHQPIPNVLHELFITPKMSFGTGHHATTFSVMQLMREINFSNMQVFDFGTGTGILAILAEKLGATEILAVDHDDWCIENAQENLENNNCNKVTIELSDDATTKHPYDIVIANINKNIIQDNFELLNKACKPNGNIILSGLLIEDEDDILQIANQKKWRKIKTITKGAWIALLLTKQF